MNIFLRKYFIMAQKRTNDGELVNCEMAKTKRAKSGVVDPAGFSADALWSVWLEHYPRRLDFIPFSPQFVYHVDCSVKMVVHRLILGRNVCDAEEYRILGELRDGCVIVTDDRHRDFVRNLYEAVLCELEIRTAYAK